MDHLEDGLDFTLDLDWWPSLDLVDVVGVVDLVDDWWQNLEVVDVVDVVDVVELVDMMDLVDVVDLMDLAWSLYFTIHLGAEKLYVYAPVFFKTITYVKKGF